MSKCSEPGCPLEKTGKCLEFPDPKSCPHYKDNDILQNDNDEDEVDEDDDGLLDDAGGFVSAKSSGAETSDTESVHTGRALTLQEANVVSHNSLTRLVILAGMVDSGKTTLILSLMHLFQTKPSYEGYIFSGSRTLVDFEEKSHPSKIASERDEAVTGRTTLEPPKFLHLKVALAKNPEIQQDILFTDISGELFRDLKDSSDECRNFHIGQRADHFALFFDADVITTLSKRASAKVAGLGILKSLVEAGTLYSNTRIQVIFSRWDLFEGKEDKEKHLKYINEIKQAIRSSFGDLFEVSFFEIASRPNRKSQYHFGYGLEKILPLWIRKSQLDFNSRILNGSEKVKVDSDRQFMHYEYRKR